MTSGKQAWLVYHQCQGTGLANCLRLLCRDIELQVVDQYSSPEHREQALGCIGEYARVIAEPSVHRTMPGAIAPERLVTIPTLGFHGYHPDFSILWHEGRALVGPTGSCHSLIAYCAFAAGLDEAHARSLYRPEVYEACGYFDAWAPGREDLLASFEEHGFDLRTAFVAWSRRGPFMHSIIHPRIECLRDLARMILQRSGMEVLSNDFLPPDNLASGETLPVYPEIGARLGIGGHYLFKRGNRQEVMDLPSYLRFAYAHFRKSPGATSHPRHVARLECVTAAIRSFA